MHCIFFPYFLCSSPSFSSSDTHTPCLHRERSVSSTFSNSSVCSICMYIYTGCVQVQRPAFFRQPDQIHVLAYPDWFWEVWTAKTKWNVIFADQIKATFGDTQRLHQNPEWWKCIRATEQNQCCYFSRAIWKTTQKTTVCERKLK